MFEIMYYVHGSTPDNEAQTATGWKQVSLSQKGIEQTRKAAERVDGSSFDAIYVSDLLRAIESAEIIFADQKSDIVVDQRLRECNYGEYTGKPNSELLYYEHINTPYPYGECLHDVEMRMRSFLNDLASKRLSKIAIVGHRVPQLALDVIVADVSWEDAINNDWRVCGNWQAGWSYLYHGEF